MEPEKRHPEVAKNLEGGRRVYFWFKWVTIGVAGWLIAPKVLSMLYDVQLHVMGVDNVTEMGQMGDAYGAVGFILGAISVGFLGWEKLEQRKEAKIADENAIKRDKMLMEQIEQARAMAQAMAEQAKLITVDSKRRFLLEAIRLIDEQHKRMCNSTNLYGSLTFGEQGLNLNVDARARFDLFEHKKPALGLLRAIYTASEIAKHDPVAFEYLAQIIPTGSMMVYKAIINSDDNMTAEKINIVNSGYDKHIWATFRNDVAKLYGEIDNHVWIYST